MVRFAEIRSVAVLLLTALGGCGGADALVGNGGATQTSRVGCGDGGAGGPVDRRDARIGPLALMGATRTAGQRRDAFNGNGYKIPAALAARTTATLTLSVPRRLRGRVGLVYTLDVQSQVLRRGVLAADHAVTFMACAGPNAPARTGWPGGIVVDRRRCATLVLRVEGGQEPLRKRVPLGHRCS